MQVACRVQTEYGFKMASKDRVPRQKDDTSATSSEELSAINIHVPGFILHGVIGLWQK